MLMNFFRAVTVPLTGTLLAGKIHPKVKHLVAAFDVVETPTDSHPTFMFGRPRLR